MSLFLFHFSNLNSVFLSFLPFILKIVAGEFYVGERKSIDYEDRRIALILDNTSSKLRGKTLAYRINISDADNISEIKGEKKVKKKSQ